MRILTAAVVASLAVLAQPIVAQTQICDLSGECHNFVNPGDADRYMRSVDVARLLELNGLATLSKLCQSTIRIA